MLETGLHRAPLIGTGDQPPADPDRSWAVPDLTVAVTRDQRKHWPGRRTIAWARECIDQVCRDRPGDGSIRTARNELFTVVSPSRDREFTRDAGSTGQGRRISLRSMAPPIHVTVTGAAGQIGYALLFRIASGQLLGPDQPVVLRLLEIEAGMKALEGVVMELDDCAFPLVADIVTTTDLDTAFDGTSWALLVGSIPRKAGMERGDLLDRQRRHLRSAGPGHRRQRRRRRAGAGGRQPLQHQLPHRPLERPRGPDRPLVRHDPARREPGQEPAGGQGRGPGRGRSPTSPIWGNHSATQFPDYANARIGGKPAAEVIDDIDWLQGDFLTTVQKRGAAVIEARGSRRPRRRPTRPSTRWSASAPRPVATTGTSLAVVSNGRVRGARRACSSGSRCGPTARAGGRWSRACTTTRSPPSGSGSPPRSSRPSGPRWPTSFPDRHGPGDGRSPGRRVTVMHDSVTLHIDAPPMAVWDLVSDVTRIGQLQPGDLRGGMARRCDRPGGGAKFRGHVKRNGNGPVYWIDLHRPRAASRDVSSPSESASADRPLNVWTYRIEPSGEGSDVTESFELARPWACGSTGRSSGGPGEDQPQRDAHHPRADEDRARRRCSLTRSAAARDELDAVAERVVHVPLGPARDVLDAAGRVPGGVEQGTRPLDAGDDQGRVGLAGRSEVLLDPEVHPQRPRSNQQPPRAARALGAWGPGGCPSTPS